MSRTTIETQKFYTVDDCKNNPKKLYIFGDNLIHEGCGGQAIIRHCENSFGIPTKRLPNMNEEAFFSDQPDEIQQTLAHLIALVTVFETGYFDTLIFPLDGVGTGRAKLKEKSPIIYNMISEFFSNRFNLNIMPL